MAKNIYFYFFPGDFKGEECKQDYVLNEYMSCSDQLYIPDSSMNITIAYTLAGYGEPMEFIVCKNKNKNKKRIKISKKEERTRKKRKRKKMEKEKGNKKEIKRK